MESIFKQSCTLDSRTERERFIQVEVFRPNHEERESQVPHFVHYTATLPGDPEGTGDCGYDEWEAFNMPGIAMRSAINWYDDATQGFLPVYLAEEVVTE